jgi:pSer/pThr/pTyr-binding forkhead associated (FHA) protein
MILVDRFAIASRGSRSADRVWRSRLERESQFKRRRISSLCAARVEKTMSKGETKVQAALVPLHAAAEQRGRTLDRDVILIGRARGADIGLDAPDVSSLHCVVWKTSVGYQIRDCGSRAGTHVNGELVKESFLHDGDVLQVGRFSFRVALPASPPKAALREARSKHLERSRRNLTRLALALRRRLRESHLQPQGA